MNREDFRERIKVNIPSGAYPFDSEEMLLNSELKKEKMNNKQKKILGNNPFDAEEIPASIPAGPPPYYYYFHFLYLLSIIYFLELSLHLFFHNNM